MLGLGTARSVIRELFEYGIRRKAEIGAENVYDFSLGNPSIPAPDCVTRPLPALSGSRTPSLSTVIPPPPAEPASALPLPTISTAIGAIMLKRAIFSSPAAPLQALRLFFGES